MESGVGDCKMKANILKRIESIEKNFYALAQETRDAQRGILQVLIPLNATILLSILGLIGPLHLGNTILSKTLTASSCICFFVSLLLCIFTVIQLLLNLALAAPKTIVNLLESYKAFSEGKKEMDVPDTKIFIDPIYFIFGFISFILGILNTTFALILSFYDKLSVIWIGLVNITVLIVILILIRPFLRANGTLKELIDEHTKGNHTI